jgi:hypothetical protein
MDPLGLALHYQAKAKQDPGESRYWNARALYYGRRASMPRAPRPAAREALT